MQGEKNMTEIKSNQIKPNQANYVSIHYFCQPLLKTFSHLCKKSFYVFAQEGTV